MTYSLDFGNHTLIVAFVQGVSYRVYYCIMPNDQTFNRTISSLFQLLFFYFLSIRTPGPRNFCDCLQYYTNRFQFCLKFNKFITWNIVICINIWEEVVCPRVITSLFNVKLPNFVFIYNGGARGVMVIVVGNSHGDTSSKGCPRGAMVKAMDCGIGVSEFVPQSRYYVHFQANNLGSGMNPLILPLWVK